VAAPALAAVPATQAAVVPAVVGASAVAVAAARVQVEAVVAPLLAVPVISRPIPQMF
jgi:hypothetical protein